MLSQSGVEKDSRVLDLGCGNGNTAIWLSQQTGCEVVGVDLSGVRIENAKTKAQQYPSLRLKFIKASPSSITTSLPREALAELGYNNIIGVDFSEQMLEVGRKKQVYTAINQGNLEEPLAFGSQASYDAILAVGVFTFGHAHPRALKNLSSLLKPGGYFVLTAVSYTHLTLPTNHPV